VEGTVLAYLYGLIVFNVPLNFEMASIEDFVQCPTEENLYKKDQLWEVADHYGVELHKQSKKDDMSATLKAYLVEKNIFSALTVGASASVEMSGVSDVSPEVSESSKMANAAPLLTGLGVGLTFEQQKQLLQQEQNNAFELEKLRQDARLREAEMAHVERKSQLELLSICG